MQEHIFLINLEIERLNTGLFSRRRVPQLQEEKRTILGCIIDDLERWLCEQHHDIPRELSAYIQQLVSDRNYKRTKPDLIKSGRQYQTSEFWKGRVLFKLDQFKRNSGLVKSEQEYTAEDISVFRLWQYDEFGDTSYIEKFLTAHAIYLAASKASERPASHPA